jgi:hypothetical protein
MLIDHTDAFELPIQLPIQLAGCVASRILDNARRGRVVALFDSSFYIETEDGFVCVGNQSLSPCPLNLVTTAPPGTNWSASGMRLDQNVNISNKAINVGNRFTFPVSGIRNWSPALLPSWRIADLEYGLECFRKACRNYAELDGLGFLPVAGCRPEQTFDTRGAAQRPIAVLREWLRALLRNPDNNSRLDLNAVKPLMGLGPGLTPSGDDFIGGVMLALNTMHEDKTCRLLWESIRRTIEEITNPISYAHLKAASQEGGNSNIHLCLAAILQGSPTSIQNCLPGICQVGHTSGWDIMAGAMLAFESWLDAQSPQALS